MDTHWTFVFKADGGACWQTKYRMFSVLSSDFWVLGRFLGLLLPATMKYTDTI